MEMIRRRQWKCQHNFVLLSVVPVGNHCNQIDARCLECGRKVELTQVIDAMTSKVQMRKQPVYQSGYVL